MGKYQKIEPIVEATQWFKGDENPIVKSHKDCNYRMCDICGGDNGTNITYYIKSGWDNLILRDSDWIIEIGINKYLIC